MGTVNLEALQKIIEKDNGAKRVLVALDSVGCGMGFTETDLVKMTGLEVRDLRKHLSLLQYYNVLEIRCTQVGTSGPYDYYMQLKKMTVKVVCELNPANQ